MKITFVFSRYVNCVLRETLKPELTFKLDNSFLISRESRYLLISRRVEAAKMYYIFAEFARVSTLSNYEVAQIECAWKSVKM